MPSDFLLAVLTIPFLLMAATAGPSNAGPVTIVDDAGQAIHLNAPPQRVVSLVPAVTEMISALGADGSLVGITYYDTHQKGLFKDLAGFDDYGRAVAERIAGGAIPDWQAWHPEGQALPEPLRLALEAFINGLIRRQFISGLPPGPVPPDNSTVPSAFGSPL